jgi:hypothetical protein
MHAGSLQAKQPLAATTPKNAICGPIAKVVGVRVGDAAGVSVAVRLGVGVGVAVSTPVGVRV